LPATEPGGRKEEENRAGILSRTVIVSYVFGFLTQTLIKQPKVFGGHFYKVSMPLLRRSLTARHLKRSARNLVRSFPKNKINNHQPIRAVFHLCGFFYSLIYRLILPHYNTKQLLPFSFRILPNHAFDISPPSVSWFSHCDLLFRRLSCIPQQYQSIRKGRDFVIPQ